MDSDNDMQVSSSSLSAYLFSSSRYKPIPSLHGFCYRIVGNPITKSHFPFGNEVTIGPVLQSRQPHLRWADTPGEAI